jgi:hypothetical protein
MSSLSGRISQPDTVSQGEEKSVTDCEKVREAVGKAIDLINQ